MEGKTLGDILDEAIERSRMIRSQVVKVKVTETAKWGDAEEHAYQNAREREAEDGLPEGSLGINFDHHESCDWCDSADDDCDDE